MKKKVLIVGAIVATTVLAGGWALAQMPSHGPDGMGPGGMQGMHGQMGSGMHGGPGFTQFDPARIDALKTELGITAAQEPVWTKYAKAVLDAATTMKTTREDINPDAVSKMSPQDRFAFVSKIREQRQTQIETVTTAANELLATLDDAQKVKARDVLPGLASFGLDTRGAMAGPRHGH